MAQIAQEGFSGTPSIQTYVIGIGNLQGLNEIAAAGGTNQAIIVQADPVVVSQQFLEALNDVRNGARSSCVLQMRAALPGQSLDYGKVSVRVSTSAGTSPYVADPGNCDSTVGGWHYDNPAAPLTMALCPATCAAVEADQADVMVGVGCSPRVP